MIVNLCINSTISKFSEKNQYKLLTYLSQKPDGKIYANYDNKQTCIEFNKVFIDTYYCDYK